MRMSRLFSRTRRKPPESTESASAELLLRAGYVRQLASGIYSYLPLAVRAIRRIEEIIRSEMDGIGGQEIVMPVVNPADIWKESARWYQIDQEMGRFTDRSGRDMVLAMTHEEVIADLTRNEIHSYRQLPSMLYHVQTKWRDDPRPRAGLIRVREFTMKDSYSLDTDAQGMEQQYEAHYGAYERIFRRCNLPVVAVGSDLGMMGGSVAHEFMYLNSIGEDTILRCPQCGYGANRQIAVFKSEPTNTGAPLELEKVHTPDAKTIADLSAFLSVTAKALAKAVFSIATLAKGEETVEQFVITVIRGDLDVNETKLAQALGSLALRPAREDEIRAHGIEPGYGSPIGARDVMVVVDSSITGETNLVAGANETDYHLKNVNYPRDFEADLVADVAYAEDGFLCGECSSALSAARGVEMGNIFQLGTKYSDSMKCTYLDDSGTQRPIYMGSYGIGIGRLLACIVEEYHDDHGVIWPPQVAPYQVHLVNLCASAEVADGLYEELTATGVDVLYEDRDERAGVKFNDADLIGVPLRVTVGDRNLSQGNIETKLRWDTDNTTIPVARAGDSIKNLVGGLEAAFAARFPLES
jgi:prolyl-tRNA synthetase